MLALGSTKKYRFKCPMNNFEISCIIRVLQCLTTVWAVQVINTATTNHTLFNVEHNFVVKAKSQIET